MHNELHNPMGHFLEIHIMIQPLEWPEAVKAHLIRIQGRNDTISGAAATSSKYSTSSKSSKSG